MHEHRTVPIIGTIAGRPVYGIAGGDGRDEPDTPRAFSLDDLRGKTPEELRAFIDVLDAHLRSLHQTDEGELRDLTADEQIAFDDGMKTREAAMAKLDEHVRIAEVFRRRPEAVRKAYDAINQGLDSPGDVRRMTNPEARDRALRTLDDRNAASHLSDPQRQLVERQVRRDPDIARRILVTENDDYRSAWAKLVTRPNPILTPEEQRAIGDWEEYRAMSEGVTTAGGFGVPVFIDPSIILTAQESDNPFLTLARQVQTTGNKWKGVSSAGVSWSFDAEGTAVSDDSPTLAQPSVDLYTARGFIPYSIEVGQDYPLFADEMATLLASGYDELLVDKFSRGNGTTEPQGIITALDADATAEVLLTTAGSFGDVDLYAVWAALPQKYRRRASFMATVGVDNAIRRFAGTNVMHAFTVGLAAGSANQLFGREVYENPYFSDFTSTTGHQNVLVVGDFNNYVIARRGGMSVELVPTLFDVTNNRPTGQRGWFAWARIGGGVTNSKAFKLLNQT